MLKRFRLKLNNFMMLAAQWCRVLVAHFARLLVGATQGAGMYLAGALGFEARLYAKVIRANGDVEDLGIIATKLVTDAFVNFLVDQLQVETALFGDYKFHAMGTGATAENVSDVALVTPVESRATGTQAEGASANIYQSVGTITATAARAIVEHGLFNAATGVTLMDRSVFTVINLATDDAIQFTYELTVPSGG